MYLMIIIGFVSIVRALWQKIGIKVEISVLFHFLSAIMYFENVWNGYHRNYRSNNSNVLQFLLIVLSEKINFMWSINVLLWDIGQWKGSGKKNKMFKKVTRHKRVNSLNRNPWTNSLRSYWQKWNQIYEKSF